MNSAESVQKIRHRHGRAARLANSSLDDGKIIGQLYLTVLSRYPTQKERSLMQQAFAEGRSRRHAVEDVMWTLLNTREFVFNH